MPLNQSYDLIIAWDSIFHAPLSQQAAATVKMCNLLTPGGRLLFTCWAYEGKVSGKMEGVFFEYGTLGYQGYLDIMNEAGCKLILLEEDQYSSGHMVFIWQKV